MDLIYIFSYFGITILLYFDVLGETVSAPSFLYIF